MACEGQCIYVYWELADLKYGGYTKNLSSDRCPGPDKGEFRWRQYANGKAQAFIATNSSWQTRCGDPKNCDCSIDDKKRDGGMVLQKSYPVNLELTEGECRYMLSGTAEMTKYRKTGECSPALLAARVDIEITELGVALGFSGMPDAEIAKIRHSILSNMELSS